MKNKFPAGPDGIRDNHYCSPGSLLLQHSRFRRAACTLDPRGRRNAFGIDAPLSCHRRGAARTPRQITHSLRALHLHHKIYIKIIVREPREKNINMHRVFALF